MYVRRQDTVVVCLDKELVVGFGNACWQFQFDTLEIRCRKVKHRIRDFYIILEQSRVIG